MYREWMRKLLCGTIHVRKTLPWGRRIGFYYFPPNYRTSWSKKIYYYLLDLYWIEIEWRTETLNLMLGVKRMIGDFDDTDC